MGLIELKKVLKDGIIIVIILMLLILALLLTDKDVYLAPALEIFLVLYASFTGWSMFERERQEGAMEYLLSLPVSRIKLFLTKFIIRSLPVTVMLIVYHLVYQQFSIHFLFSNQRFIPIYITVFLLSASFSLSIKSFLSTFFITLFLSLGLFHFIKILDVSKNDLNASLQAVFSYLAVLLLFTIMFNKYDIKPISYFNKKFIPGLVLVVILIFGITYVTTHVKWWHCYMTDEGDLIRVSRSKTVVMSEGQDNKIIPYSLSPLYERKQKLYASLWKGKKKSRQLVRYDLKSGKIEKHYDIDQGYWFHHFIDKRASLGNRIYFLLTRYGHKKYKIMEIRGDESRIITVNGDFGDEDFHMICGVIENPLQFIVMTMSKTNRSTGSSVFRILENGHVEKLFTAKSVAFWNNRLLRFTDQAMILYETGAEIKEIFRRNGDIKKVRRKYENYIQKKVIIKIDEGFHVYDLQDQTQESINIQKLPYFYFLTDEGDLRLIWTQGPEISVSTWKDNHFQVENVWYTQVEGLKIIRVFSSGVVVYNQKQHEVFRFQIDEGR
jgi:ABC-type transport system involved in multi-copper enzyme maturation permease subunit